MRTYKILILILLVSYAAGCTPTGYVVTPTPRMGIYHRVQRGETLWGISQHYDIPLDTIAHANRLPDKRKIYVGQKLFIPTAASTAQLPKPALLDKKGFAWPVKGKVIAFYGSMEDNVKNKGIDIKARHGSNVRAARGGTVSYVDENMKGFGKTIIVDHGDGFSTVYAYNAAILVDAGDVVSKSTVIAKVGSTGRAAGPRLHFEIRKNKKARNPFYYLP